MPELKTVTYRVKITALSHNPITYAQTTSWAVGQMRSLAPGITPEFISASQVFMVYIPRSLDLATLQNHLGDNFRVSAAS